MVMHQGEAPKWCVRIILVHGAIINQTLAVKQPFFNVFASILITNSNFHDALTVQAEPRAAKRGGEQIMLAQLAVFAAAPVIQAGGRVFFVLFGLADEAKTHAG